MESCTKIWDDVLHGIREKVGPLRFNLWFKNTRLESFDGDCANIVVPNVFTQVWLQENFTDVLRDGVGKLVNQEGLSLRFTVLKSSSYAGDTAFQTAVSPQEKSIVEKGRNQSPLARNLRLEDFIVGSNNRIAYTAALEMVKERSSPFNPLFIHGSVGVGKTHLLQGIWNYIKEEMSINAVYMPAEKWTNEFIYSLQKGKMESFRQKYRNVDVLLIDDVHFFSNKQGVQEEFLHTFNALYDLSKKIIFASDVHPKTIGHIKETLASRFMSGMVVKMDKPDFATRLLILRTKAAKFEICFSEEVLEFIAEKHGSSVREIESTLTTLSAHARFNEKKLDLRLVNEVLGEIPHDEGQVIKVESVEGVILNYYNITRNELHSAKKIKSVSFPRQVCMYLVKTLMDWSYQQIGDHFGNKKHSTVMFAIKKIKDQIDSDKQFRVCIEMLIERIKKEKK